MAIKRYKIESSQEFDLWVTLDVDHDKLTPELATEINDFWSDKEGRLTDADGDAVKAVIKMAGGIFLAYVLDVNEGYNTYGMQRQFDNQYEGWPTNGEAGIKLVDWSGRPDVDYFSLELSEVEHGG